jgi:AAA15 family ATPase/GTPase
MIDSIDIKNFRNLDGLSISSFARINLFTGKNNTGKSTLLEAIALLVAKGDFSYMLQILNDRGENYLNNNDKRKITESFTNSFSSLFTNRIVDFNHSCILSIDSKWISLVLEFYKIEPGNDDQLKTVKEDEINYSNLIPKTGISIRENNFHRMIPFNKETLLQIQYLNSFVPDNFQFIPTNSIEPEINGKLWDKITLTEKEQFVIDALKIIEPKVERIAFIDDTSKKRKAVIKIEGNKNVLPLQSMGDGINRILTIILALVNAENGYLLIDEFENGLHHTVQENLWKVIFYLAERLNIQVFATTHSEDCIRGFENILNQQDTIKGKLIRLDNIDGKIVEVEFEANELRIANESGIEIR